MSGDETSRVYNSCSGRAWNEARIVRVLEWKAWERGYTSWLRALLGSRFKTKWWLQDQWRLYVIMVLLTVVSNTVYKIQLHNPYSGIGIEIMCLSMFMLHYPLMMGLYGGLTEESAP